MFTRGWAILIDKKIKKNRFEKLNQYLVKTHSEIVPRIAKIDKKVSDRMLSCGHFVYTCDCKNCDCKHFAGSNRCYCRFCLNCSHLKSLAYVAKNLEKIIPLMDSYNLNMLTMTIKDNENLKHQIQDLKEAWRYVSNSNKYRSQFKSRFVGGFRSYEIKIGKNSDLWHTHCHAIVLTPKSYAKDYNWFRQAWKHATSDLGSIEIHKLKQREGQYLGILKALYEASKYITSPDKKTLDIDDDRFTELYQNAKGFRAVNSWGLLYGVVKEAEEYDSESITEDKLINFICQQCGGNEYEIKTVLRSKMLNESLLDLGGETKWNYGKLL